MTRFSGLCSETNYFVAKQQNNGEGGIRTLGTGLYRYNGLAIRRIQPCSATSPKDFAEIFWISNPPEGVRDLILDLRRLQYIYQFIQ